MKKALLIAGGLGVLALGGYLAYKHFKNEEVVEEEITLSEAREIVKEDSEPVTKYSTEEVDALIAEAKKKMEQPIIIDDETTKNDIEEHIDQKSKRLSKDEIHELIDDAHDEVNWNASFSTTYSGEPVTENTEEDNELRHEPNSEAALEQFINMELADWNEMDASRKLLNHLFDFKFIPTTAGDRMTITQIEDYRQEFFGESTWNNNTSFADVILHYARVTDYNVGRGIRYWAEHFLEVSGLEDSENDDQIMGLIDRMNDHRHYYDENGTFGLFGLSNEQLEMVEEVTKRYVDKSLNYEIEFNIFLQGV